MVIKGDKAGKVKNFTAEVSVQEHPGQLKCGFTPGVYIRTAKAACKMSNIKWKLHPKKTNGNKMEGANFIETGDRSNFIQIKPNDTIIIPQKLSNFLYEQIGTLNAIFTLTNIVIQLINFSN